MILNFNFSFENESDYNLEFFKIELQIFINIIFKVSFSEIQKISFQMWRNFGKTEFIQKRLSTKFQFSIESFHSIFRFSLLL